MSKKFRTGAEALAAIGATDIKGYCLISNFGYTFVYKGKRYDARFWANVYGAAVNRWGVMSMEKREDDPRFVQEVDPKIEKRILSALENCEEG